MTEGYNQQYFEARTPEFKDFYMTFQWLEHLEPKTVFCFGDGVGKHTYIAQYFGFETEGYDPFVPEEQMITKVHKSIPLKKYSLVISVDVLEHVRPEETDETIDKMLSLIDDNGHILLSICDATLWSRYPDPTHVNKHTRAWWEYQFTKRGLLPKELPKDWLFREQLYLFQKVN